MRHVLRCSLDWPARVHVSRPRVKSALALVETYRFVERYVPECSDDTLQRRWRRPPGDYCCWLSCLEQKGLELKLAWSNDIRKKKNRRPNLEIHQNPVPYLPVTISLVARQFPCSSSSVTLFHLHTSSSNLLAQPDAQSRLNCCFENIQMSATTLFKLLQFPPASPRLRYCGDWESTHQPTKTQRISEQLVSERWHFLEAWLLLPQPALMPNTHPRCCSCVCANVYG